MNTAMLIPADGAGCPFLFFEEHKKYRIYNDGRHYIATPIVPISYKCDFKYSKQLSFRVRKKHNLRSNAAPVEIDTFINVLRSKMKRQLDENGQKKNRNSIDKINMSVDRRRKGAPSAHSSHSAIDILFDCLFVQAMVRGLRDTKYDKPMTEFVRDGILKLYPDYENLDELIANKIKRKYHNIGVRKKRFRRKAYLNRWNYFVTFTYDDKKHDEETFERKLRKCFSNLHTRRGWRIMGGFERAPETGRLHFHGLVYVPAGEMLGEITEKTDYSTAQQQMQTRNENSFFETAFGRNDFEELGKMELQYGNTIDYILKYISKTNGRLYYSRGIPSDIVARLDEREIVTEFKDFVQKFVLFDDTINWERDIMRYNKHKQMSIIDIICNPPKIA